MTSLEKRRDMFPWQTSPLPLCKLSWHEELHPITLTCTKPPPAAGAHPCPCRAAAHQLWGLHLPRLLLLTPPRGMMPDGELQPLCQAGLLCPMLHPQLPFQLKLGNPPHQPQPSTEPCVFPYPRKRLERWKWPFPTICSAALLQLSPVPLWHKFLLFSSPPLAQSLPSPILCFAFAAPLPCPFTSHICLVFALK